MLLHEIHLKKNISFCLGLLGQGTEELDLGGSFLLKGVLGLFIVQGRRYFFARPEGQNLMERLGK